jgi:multidrug resistance protein MdtO
MREPAAPSSLFAQVIHDLAPFPGRAALTWRIALLCALVSAAAMLYKIPEAAISCYLIIFLMKPDAVQNIGTAFA